MVENIHLLCDTELDPELSFCVSLQSYILHAWGSAASRERLGRVLSLKKKGGEEKASLREGDRCDHGRSVWSVAAAAVQAQALLWYSKQEALTHRSAMGRAAQAEPRSEIHSRPR